MLPTLTTGAVAQMLGAELRGPADTVLARPGTLEDADERTLTFVRDAAYLRAFVECPAPAAVVERTLSLDTLPEHKCAILVDDPDVAMLCLLEAINAQLGPPPQPGVHITAAVDPSASIHPTAHIGPGCVVEAGSMIGARTVLHARVVVARRCTIGEDCVVHPGVVIGADGFGYRPDPRRGGMPTRIPHLFGVRIGDRVEVGANTTIDRGKFADTTIGDDTKIDNLVQIGHNCRIGRACLICGQAGLSGSVTLGDGVTIAGQVGIADNVKVGDGVTLGARTGLARDLPPGGTYAGAPAVPRREYGEQVVMIAKAKQLYTDLRTRIDKLERQTDQAPERVR